jgi:hypothetical protein
VERSSPSLMAETESPTRWLPAWAKAAAMVGLRVCVAVK